MLHAPTNEAKTETAQSRSQLARQSERELHPRLLNAAGPYSFSGMSSVSSGSSPEAQRRQALAGIQAAHGNQAVLRMLHSPQQVARVTPLRPSQGMMLQRKCACGGSSESGGECAECKAKGEGTMQRAAVSAAPANSVPPIVHDVLRSSGRPLDTGTRAFMEPRFGHDFSHVRVHTDARAAESARAVNALAYTVGRNVVFGEGQYAPHSSPGGRLIAHELAHVIQQRPMPGAPLSISDPDSSLEYEADRAAEQVVGGGANPALRSAGAPMVSRQVDTRSMPAPDGRVIKVERNVNPGHCKLAPQSRASTSSDITASNAFLQIDLCRGSVAGQVRGEIDYGEALQQASKA